LNGARKFGEKSEYCDLPLLTARAQLEWLKENLRGEAAPDLIIWSGDNVSHQMTVLTE
jgi:hypothetical protein